MRLAQLLARSASLLALTVSVAARAQSDQTALAESLYQEGKKLLEERRYAEACPKLAESQRIEPGGGTELALGLCYEGEGKLASAWASLSGALATARRMGRAAREQAALEALKRIEGKVPQLSLAVSKEARAVAGLEIRRDGVLIGPAAYDVAIPVDPGPVRISVTAPGRRPLELSATLSPGEQQVLAVRAPPRLDQPAENVQRDTQVPPPSPQGMSGRTVAGLALGGVAVVSLSAGAAAALVHLGKAREADSRCPQVDCPDEVAVSLSRDARTYGAVSIAAFGAGAGLTAASLYLLLSRGEPAASLSPRVGPGVAALQLQGRF